jgi:hypothetical protein
MYFLFQLLHQFHHPVPVLRGNVRGGRAPGPAVQLRLLPIHGGREQTQVWNQSAPVTVHWVSIGRFGSGTT